MQLCKVINTKLVHREIDLPPFLSNFKIVTGQKGLACSINHGWIFKFESFTGEAEQVTCPACKQIT